MPTRPRKIFVSYSRVQKDWVHDRLYPCLHASGVEVLIDTERFRVAHEILGEMDSLQDRADASLVVLSPDYLASTACLHEMRRAVAKDPGFNGGTIPVSRLDSDVPEELNPADKLRAPLRVDLRDDRKPEPWRQLFDACAGDLGSDAPHWLEARDDVRRLLQRDESVNLIVQGHPKSRELVNHLAQITALRVVDLALPETISRPGLLAQMLGLETLPNRPKGQDLVEFKRQLEVAPASVVLMHADLMENRNYGSDFFFTVRYLVSDVRKLKLVVVTRSRPFLTYVPAKVKASMPTFPVVELKGRP